jgi:hypothetical protein
MHECYVLEVPGRLGGAFLRALADSVVGLGFFVAIILKLIWRLPKNPKRSVCLNFAGDVGASAVQTDCGHAVAE